MSKTSEIRPGEIPKMVAYIADLVARTGTKDPAYIMANLTTVFPKLQNKERCANCDANMVQDVYVFDCLDAWLLIEMAKQVRERFKKVSFTEANQIRIQDLPISYSAKSRTTQMSKLGLVAQLQVKNKNDKMVGVPGIWVITSKGWQALRGEPVRRRVAVWRGIIQDRYEDETITLAEAFRMNREKIDDLVARNKKAKGDYRFIAESYDPVSWQEFGKVMQGNLL